MKRAAGGFTLIEVLVALVIVAFGMAALLGTLSSAADSAIFIRDKTFANWIALNRISELRLAATRPQKGKSTADLDFAGRKWRYEQEVVTTDVPGVLRIDVRVSPKDATASTRKNTSATSWTASASGVVGDAVQPPNGIDPDWNGGPFPGEPSGDGQQDEDEPAPAPAPSPAPPGGPGSPTRT